jgi:hypothetical protein
MPIAGADQPPAKTFMAPLTAAAQVPPCPQATNAARGHAVFHVRDEATGTVDYKVVANNVPGDVTAAHIHLGPFEQAVVQPPLLLTFVRNNGVVAAGTLTNPGLVAGIRNDPEGHQVSVHSTGCFPSPVIRGQFDDRGPLNN